MGFTGQPNESEMLGNISQPKVPNVDHVINVSEIQTVDAGPLYFAFVDDEKESMSNEDTNKAKNRLQFIYSQLPDEVVALKGFPLQEAKAKLVELEQKAFDKMKEA